MLQQRFVFVCHCDVFLLHFNFNYVIYFVQRVMYFDDVRIALIMEIVEMCKLNMEVTL